MQVSCVCLSVHAFYTGTFLKANMGQRPTTRGNAYLTCYLSVRRHPAPQTSSLGPSTFPYPVMHLAIHHRGDSARAEDEELEALRHRWATMDAASSNVGVDQQMQAWALQRARLEEEIIRRQEASRYAAPGAHGGSAGDGCLSPYAGLVSEAADGGAGMPGGGVLANTAAMARDVREAAMEEHAAEVSVPRSWSRRGTCQL